MPLDWLPRRTISATCFDAGPKRVRHGAGRRGGRHRESPAERKGKRVLLDWAMTVSNLGNALLTLGERESGTSRLEEAVGCQRVPEGIHA